MKAAVLSIALVACAACAARPAEPLSNRVRPVAAEPVAASPPPGVAATLARLDQFSSEMCSCPDRDCVERVVDDMSRWVHELASAGEANPRVNVLQDARAKAAAERVSRCMAVVYARRAQPVAPP